MSRQKALLWLLLPLLVAAQPPQKKIARAADLPEFQYPIKGSVENLVMSDEQFRPFAAQVRQNVESVLRDYAIEDTETRRSLLNILAALDLLEGKDQDLRRRLDDIRASEEKPGQKLMSGLMERAILDARAKSRDRNSPAYRRAVYDFVREALDLLPFDVIQNDLQLAKRMVQVRTAPRAIDRIRARYEPVVQKTGVLSSNLAHELPAVRVALSEIIPLNETLNEAFGAYLTAHAREKPDIWAERDVTLERGAGYSPVTVAVWDFGVDTAVFQSQVKRDASGSPSVIAYDLFWRRTTGDLLPLKPEQQRKYPEFKARLKGRDDMEANIDSQEAAELRKEWSEFKPDQIRSLLDEFNLFDRYVHGTHVSGVALAGNPYARLVVARMTSDYRMVPEVCRSRELSERIAEAHQYFVEFFRKNAVRVVNMSFVSSPRMFATKLELCGVIKSADERNQLAREFFDIEKRGMERAFRSAPEILFVAGAGNENSDSSFNEFIPAGIVLPNTIAVGAVDRGGDEAAFTSYGPAVVVHANGYQVISYVPGGDRLRLSGTSMAAPQVANLAAKMLAVNPNLTAAEVKQIIIGTADRTADGRRNLINPKKAVAAATQRK